MSSTWNCTGGALQMPSAGLCATVCRRSWHRSIGHGETHILAVSFNRKITWRAADIRNCSFRSVWDCKILATRRKIMKVLLISQGEIGNSFGCSGVHNRLFNPGCSHLAWSQRFLTCAHNNNGSKNISSSSPESPRFDIEEDTEHSEKRRGSNLFQDFGNLSDREETDGDQWQKTKADAEPPNSNASDLFREDSDRSSVWSDEERLKDNEGGANSVGYESWDENEKSTDSATSGSAGSVSASAADSLAIGGKEPVYQVLEVHPDGDVVHREVSRRQLLRSIAGLRLRDIRSVDPSLWVTNSVPAILVRDQAILLNLGSLRAIATSQSVLIFERKSVGTEAFMAALLPRLRTANGHGPIMPFELEVVEAALISRTQRLERMLMDVEPRVMALLKVLPIRYTADVLEELRLGKQALVELAAKAGALRQMLLEMLEHPEDIRKMTIMGRTCNIRKDNGSVECSIPLDKQSAEDEEEEIEMLLEYYLQRCDSCHGQAEKLLDAAKEMEDSIGVNLSSRRLEVSRLELLLQVGTFCSALGALVAGIFGMNLKSYLEDHVTAFYFTTAGIVFGGMALFIIMFTYLKVRKIL